MAHPRQAIAAGLLVGLGACSPYAYRDQAGSFNTAVSETRNAYLAGRTSLAAERNRGDRALWLVRRPLLAVQNCSAEASAPPACVIVSREMSLGTQGTRHAPVAAVAPTIPTGPAEVDACEVVAAPAREVQPPGADGVNQLGPAAREQIFSALARYTAGIQALTRAEDRTSFDAAAGQMSAALGGLATAAGTATGAPAAVALGPLVKAGADALLWLSGTELDRRRYETLRDAVIRACQPLRILAEVSGVMLEEQRGNRLDAIRKGLDWQVSLANARRDRRVSDDRTYAALIDDLFSTAKSFDTLRATQPAALGRAVAKAHDKLVLAVWNNDGQFEAFSKAMGELADRVDELRKSVDAHDAASDSR